MVAAAQHVRNHLGLPTRSFETLVPHVNRGMRELYLNCFDDFIAQETSAEEIENKISHVQGLYEKRYGEFIAVETQLYPEIVEALHDAKSLGRIVVITNKPEHLSVRLLESLKILPSLTLLLAGIPALRPSQARCPCVTLCKSSAVLFLKTRFSWLETVRGTHGLARCAALKQFGVLGGIRPQLRRNQLLNTSR